MASLTGSSWPVFIGVTLILMGGGAFLTGQSVARRWLPAWACVHYSLLLTIGDRFLVYSLFGGELWSLAGFLVDFVVLLAICFVAYRLTLAHLMVRQYPWELERAGPFGWRPRSGGDAGSDG